MYFFKIIFHYRLLQDIEYRFLCYTVNPCSLSSLVTICLFSISVNLFLFCTQIRSDQIKSVAQSCPTLCDPMNRSTPGLPVHHQLPEFTETHVHRLYDAIQPSHPLSSPSPPAPNIWAFLPVTLSCCCGCGENRKQIKSWSPLKPSSLQELEELLIWHELLFFCLCFSDRRGMIGMELNFICLWEL